MEEIYFVGFFFRSHQDRTNFFRALKFERVFLLKSENFQFSKFRVLGISNNLKVANFLNFEFDQFFKKKIYVIHTNYLIFYILFTILRNFPTIYLE